MAKPIKITPVLRGNDAIVFNQSLKKTVETVKSDSSKYANKLKSMRNSYTMFEKSLVK